MTLSPASSLADVAAYLRGIAANGYVGTADSTIREIADIIDPAMVTVSLPQDLVDGYLGLPPSTYGRAGRMVAALRTSLATPPAEREVIAIIDRDGDRWDALPGDRFQRFQWEAMAPLTRDEVVDAYGPVTDVYAP